MMNSEKIKKWEYTIDTKSCIYLDTLIDSRERLEIKLVTEDDLSYILYFNDFLGYRNFNESERLYILEEYPILTETTSFFFIGKNTNFTKWLVKESLNILHVEDVIHFIVTTSDYVIEVLCREIPILKIVE